MDGPLVVVGASTVLPANKPAFPWRPSILLSSPQTLKTLNMEQQEQAKSSSSYATAVLQAAFVDKMLGKNCKGRHTNGGEDDGCDGDSDAEESEYGTTIEILIKQLSNLPTLLAALLYFAIPPAKVKLVAEGGKSTKKTKMLTGIEQLDVDKREQLKNLLAGLGLPLSAMLPLCKEDVVDMPKKRKPTSQDVDGFAGDDEAEPSFDSFEDATEYVRTSWCKFRADCAKHQLSICIHHKQGGRSHVTRKTGKESAIFDPTHVSSFGRVDTYDLATIFTMTFSQDRLLAIEKVCTFIHASGADGLLAAKTVHVARLSGKTGEGHTVVFDPLFSVAIAGQDTRQLMPDSDLTLLLEKMKAAAKKMLKKHGASTTKALQFIRTFVAECPAATWPYLKYFHDMTQVRCGPKAEKARCNALTLSPKSTALVLTALCAVDGQAAKLEEFLPLTSAELLSKLPPGTTVVGWLQNQVLQMMDVNTVSVIQRGRNDNDNGWQYRPDTDDACASEAEATRVRLEVLHAVQMGNPKSNCEIKRVLELAVKRL